MGSHSVTCHPTQVNAPHLTPAMQAGTRFTYPGGTEGWVDLVDLISPRPGIEPATFQSRLQRPAIAPPRQVASMLLIFLRINWLVTTLLGAGPLKPWDPWPSWPVPYLGLTVNSKQLLNFWHKWEHTKAGGGRDSISSVGWYVSAAVDLTFDFSSGILPLHVRNLFTISSAWLFPSPSYLRRIVEFQWFLIALSVLSPASIQIITQLQTWTKALLFRDI